MRFFLIAILLLCLPCEVPAQPDEGEAVSQPAESLSVVEDTYARAVELSRRGQAGEALPLFEDLLRQYPNREDILADYIVACAWDNRHTKAIQLFEQNEDKDLPAYVLAEVARSYRVTDELDKAVELYAQAVKHYPDDEDAFDGLILSLREAGLYEQAQDRLEERLRTEPDNMDYRLASARVAWEQGREMTMLEKLSALPPAQNTAVENFLDALIPVMTDNQWRTFSKYFKEQAPGQPMPQAEAMLFVALVDRGILPAKSLEQKGDALIGAFADYTLNLQLAVARLFNDKGHPQRAEHCYTEIIRRRPDEPEAVRWVARQMLDRHEIQTALQMVDKALAENADNTGLLFLKGEILETDGQYLQAMKIYKQILKDYPGNVAAANLKNRALMDMGANSVALENLEQASQADPIIIQRARGNRAMQAIRWEEPQRAVDIINEELDRLEQAMKQPNEKRGLSEEEIQTQYWRARWDRLIAYRQLARMQDIVDEYERFVADPAVEFPFWVYDAAAGAYLYLQKPEKARILYEKVLAKDPDNFNARLSLYHTLVELGQYEEAGEILDQLDAEQPPRVYLRGILQDNWTKADLAYNRAWFLISQDKYAQAQNYLEERLFIAPINTNLRAALAQLYYYRGWPRKSLEEFEIIRTIDPDNVVSANGYSMALNANMSKEDARRVNRELLEKYPKNKHVQRIRRQFEVEQMTSVIADAYFLQEFPGVDESFFSLRAERPVGFHHTLFVETLRRETLQSGEDDLVFRGYVGDRWQPNNFWQLTGTVSQELDTGDNFGWSLQAGMTPDDHWTFGAGYESFILDVPLRSRQSGVDVRQFSVSAAFRASELFNTGMAITRQEYTDGNEVMSYLWKTDTAVTRGPYWKTRLETEFFAGSNSKTDVDYFSPESVYSFYIVPMVEHTWYRRYEKALVDRFYVGIGQQWEEEFPAENVGYLRYEQDYRFSDTLGWLIGMTYSLRNYAGDDVNAWNIYSTLRRQF